MLCCCSCSDHHLKDILNGMLLFLQWSSPKGHFKYVMLLFLQWSPTLKLVQRSPTSRALSLTTPADHSLMSVKVCFVCVLCCVCVCVCVGRGGGLRKKVIVYVCVCVCLCVCAHAYPRGREGFWWTCICMRNEVWTQSMLQFRSLLPSDCCFVS